MNRLIERTLISLFLAIASLFANFSVSFASEGRLIFAGDRDYPPIEYLEQGVPKGMSIDLMEELSEAMGRKIEVRLMQWNEAQQKLLSGEVDALTTMSITEMRKELYDFSDVTFPFQYSIFVRTEQIGIQTPEDLEGKIVGVTEGGLPRQVLEINPSIQLATIENDLEGFRRLLAQEIDAVATDRWVGAYTIQTNKIRGITVRDVPIAERHAGIAVKKGDTELLNAINLGLRKLTNDGTKERIIRKWEPKEILFLTREQIYAKIVYAIFVFLITIVAVGLFWISSLRKANRALNAARLEALTMMKESRNAHQQAEQAIHDLHQSQDQLQHLNETLEQRVRERTKLAEARAKQLQSLAVEVIEAEERERRRMAEILHDDLQQVLAAASMQLEASAVTENGATAARLLQEAIQKSRRLSHELSPPVLQHSGLGASLKWLVRQLRGKFGLEVRIQVPQEEKAEDTATKTFLFRATQELLFNAKKHAGVDQAEIELSYVNDCINLTLSDNGKGFKPEILDENHKGIGLLRIRERAAYFGGHFEIDSTLGKGSRFTVTVPISTATECRLYKPAEMNSDQSSQIHESVSQLPDRSLRVLFVDDHRVMRQGLIKLISGQPQIQVVGEAENGAEAVEMVRYYNPDVVVMDVSMPVMDGIEATRRIKSEYPDVRVIGLSMHEDDNLAQKLRMHGAETLLSKTSSSSVLLEAIYNPNSQPDIRRDI